MFFFLVIWFQVVVDELLEQGSHVVLASVRIIPSSIRALARLMAIIYVELKHAAFPDLTEIEFGHVFFGVEEFHFSPIQSDEEGFLCVPPEERRIVGGQIDVSQIDFEAHRQELFDYHYV